MNNDDLFFMLLTATVRAAFFSATVIWLAYIIRPVLLAWIAQ